MNKAGVNLFHYKHPFLLGMYPRAQPLGNTVGICSASIDFAKKFSKMVVSIYSPFSNV